MILVVHSHRLVIHKILGHMAFHNSKKCELPFDPKSFLAEGEPSSSSNRTSETEKKTTATKHLPLPFT
jgi:hypothetical protein